MPPYVWMPPVHTQHKESMLCQTKGVSICPHTYGCSHMFGCLPVCVDTPICLDAPVCLDNPMFGCSPYVWMMFGCPLYIHNTKKACFVRQRECPYAPYIWMPPVHKQHNKSMLCQTKGCPYAPHTFGCPLYVSAPLVCLDAPMFGHPICLDAPVCLDSPVCLGAPYVWSPFCMVGCPHMFGHPAVCLDASICWASPCMFGCPPNIWGHPKV